MNVTVAEVLLRRIDVKNLGVMVKISSRHYSLIIFMS
jgi:hypothetical protein